MDKLTDAWWNDGYKPQIISDKIVVIGGTGTLGSELLRQFENKLNIHVVSRGEHKQQEFKKKYPHFKFHICDIRDKRALAPLIKDAKLVFHFAALKHIDVCEENPTESLKTNTLGTLNIAELCIQHKVKRCVFSSTDKAVDPISAYGYSKAMSEKILQHYNKTQNTCRFIIFRWGNIIDSQGSVIPFFIDRIRFDSPVYLTNPKMTRFFIRISEAVNFMLSTLDDKFLETKPDVVYMPPNIRSTSVVEIIAMLGMLLEKSPQIIETGLRGVEKLSEQLISVHEDSPVNSKDTLMSRDELKSLLEPLVYK